jgi:hypothetical protein
MRNLHLFPVARLVSILLSAFVLFQFAACVPHAMIASSRISASDLEPATYTVICYSNLAVDYLTTVAFLDLEGDAYTIEPQDASFTYNVSKGLKTEEALALAENFLRVNSRPSYYKTEVKAIRGPDSNLLGYEVRPLYQPFVYGFNDVLDITYYLRPENKIKVWIRLKDRINSFLFHDTRR